MKRIGSSDSFGALISISPATGLEWEEEEGGHVAEKKRRLSVEQVKALEKNFEVENKLEAERKTKLAQQLGLQPRQVAVWFQNRRARWKTKQLERDYGVLKANFDCLNHNYESLQLEKESLLNQIKELKSKMSSTNSNSNSSSLLSDSDNENKAVDPVKLAMRIKENRDGSSDSDSSAMFSEDQSPNNNSSSGLLFNGLGFSDLGGNVYHPQMVKMEEHDLDCNFFSDEQPPTLHWYSHIAGLDL